jgi:hypothetical protein
MSKEIDLHQTTDASEWAREFKRLFPDSDESLMLTWFANAIMVGYDAVKKTDADTQIFFCIKRDEEPRYWNPGFGWQGKPMLTTSAGEHNRWRRDLDLKALLPDNPTARIVKVMVEEVGG